MRLILLAAVIFLLSAPAVIAQELPESTFGIEGNIGTSTTDSFGFVAGGIIHVDIPVSKSAKITFSGGYQKFTYKKSAGSTNIFGDPGFVPLLVGARFNLAPKLFIHGQGGYSIITVRNRGGHFTYLSEIGYEIIPKIDLAVKYFSAGKLNAVLLRVAFSFDSFL